jgi:hypothetical protein
MAAPTAQPVQAAAATLRSPASWVLWPGGGECADYRACAIDQPQNPRFFRHPRSEAKGSSESFVNIVDQHFWKFPSLVAEYRPVNELKS